MVPATQKDPEGWGPADKFTVVVESAGIKVLEFLDAAVAAGARAYKVAELLGVGPHHPAALASAVHG